MGNFLRESVCCKYMANNLQTESLDYDPISTEKSLNFIYRLQAVYRGYIFRKKRKILQNFILENKVLKVFDISKIPGKFFYDDRADYLENYNKKIQENKNKIMPFELNEKEVCILKTGFLKKFTIQYSDSSVYEGYFNKDWEREGYGVLYLPNGLVYEGFFKSNLMEGRGRLINPDGFMYVGEFLKDRANGFGKYLSLEKVIYTGQWKNDHHHGYGEETFPDSSFYEGNYLSGKKNGKGKLKWADGFEYEGEFLNNDIHGFGTFRWKDGRIYQGQWNNNKMNGYGIFIWPDRKKYIGCYKNDNKEGYGNFYWPDGTKYEGNWLKGKQNGFGIFVDKSTETRYGLWENGVIIESYESKENINNILNEIHKIKIGCKFDEFEKLCLNFEKYE